MEMSAALRYGSSMLLAASLLGCRGIEATPPPNPSGVVQTTTDLLRYYPELAGLQLQDAGNFRTTTSLIRWLNYSDGTLDISDATATYQFLEEFALEQQRNGAINTNSPQGRQSHEIKPRVQNEKNIVIAPTRIAFSSWLTKQLEGNSEEINNMYGMTVVPNPNVTFLWLDGINPDPLTDILGTNQNGANTVFFVEACQANVTTSVNGKFDLLFQEVVCNSLGYAMGYKLAGNTHDQYRELIKQQLVSRSRINPALKDSNLLTFGSDAYNRFPVLKPIRF